MQLRTLLVIPATAAALVIGAALPASAADTAATFSLTGGELILSVGASAALTNEASGVAANVITGTLGEVAVSDARGGTAGWVASAASTTFTGTDLSVSDSVAYTNGAVTETGTNTIAAVTSAALTTTPAAVASATAVSGNNTASWNPTLDVSMPAGALAGDYAGTVTTSLV